jgi:hypothetical protein
MLLRAIPVLKVPGVHWLTAIDNRIIDKNDHYFRRQQQVEIRASKSRRIIVVDDAF